MRTAAVLLLSAVLLVLPVAAQDPLPVAPALTPPPFEEWLLAFRAEAESKGISRELLDRALAHVEPVEQILERDRTQAEFTLDLDAYLRRRLTAPTVRMAQRMFTRHRTLLQRVERAYGVPGRVVVAVWGLESNFGRFAGVRPTIPALATLAYDPRRSIMFRQELFNALEIVNRGEIELDKLRGSWAGALGQPQFMPSSYLTYAQDFDGDGRRDIWSSLPDVFASIAFYLQQHGWQPGWRWGREVRASSAVDEKLQAIARRREGCRARKVMTEPLPLSQWRAIGVRTTGNALVPALPEPASLVVAGNRKFLLYGNYEALLGYNCSHSYALSVALLSDRIH